MRIVCVFLGDRTHSKNALVLNLSFGNVCLGSGEFSTQSDWGPLTERGSYRNGSVMRLRGPARRLSAAGLSLTGALSLSQRRSSWTVRQSQTQAWSESQQKTTPRGRTAAKRGSGNRTGRVGHLIEGDSFSQAWNGAVHAWCWSKVLSSQGIECIRGRYTVLFLGFILFFGCPKG